MTQRQKTARDALYVFLTGSDTGPVDMRKLGDLYHNLADALLRASVPATIKMGCPTDIILALSTITSEGNFDPNANVLTRSCSQFQYCFRSIHLTIARLMNERRSNDAPSLRNTQEATEGIKALDTADDSDDEAGDDVSASHILQKKTTLAEIRNLQVLSTLNIQAESCLEPCDIIDQGIDEPLDILDDDDRILWCVLRNFCVNAYISQ